ncbi:MAG: hypothetical protein O7I93_03020 [Gemmatimonadetes bacterium]|nr:hypothetical protein [Gemmatimonadota bacterium]
MSAWETSVLPVTASAEDDEVDDSGFEEDEELADTDESVGEPDDDLDEKDYPEYEELDDEAPRHPHHDHPRQGDWDG